MFKMYWFLKKNKNYIHTLYNSVLRDDDKKIVIIIFLANTM